MPEFISKMDGQTFAALLSAVATFLAFLASLLAAFAAWKGPAVAAKIAEQLRRENDNASERRRMKLNIFSALMEERAASYTTEAVKAFNLIDIVYIDNRSVRDAWAELYLSMNINNKIPEHEQRKRFRVLLAAMASDLNLGEQLRLDDFERVYSPNALQEEQDLKFLQRRAALKQLLNSDTSPSANALIDAVKTDMFPPPPKNTTGS